MTPQRSRASYQGQQSPWSPILWAIFHTSSQFTSISTPPFCIKLGIAMAPDPFPTYKWKWREWVWLRETRYNHDIPIADKSTAASYNHDILIADKSTAASYNHDILIADKSTAASYNHNMIQHTIQFTLQERIRKQVKCLVVTMTSVVALLIVHEILWEGAGLAVSRQSHKNRSRLWYKDRQVLHTGIYGANSGQKIDSKNGWKKTQ